MTTTHAYDSRLRLTGLQSMQNGNFLKNLSYEMDGVGNIEAITDHRGISATDRSSVSQSFIYDDLDRLKKAAGSGYGVIDFNYDALGNLIYKSSPAESSTGHIADDLVNLGRMTYGDGTDAGTRNRHGRAPGAPPGPHALVATTSGQSYQYDDNGNMTVDDRGHTYAWDFKDRVSQIIHENSASEFVYDYSDRRIIKRVRSGSTVKTTCYVNPNYELRDNSQVKYVFAGAKWIARIEGKAPQASAGARQVLTFQTGWNVFSLFVEPTDPAVETVLKSISGAYKSVWAFDTKSDSYLKYDPGQSGNTLTEMHAGRGYLIEADYPVTLVIEGSPASNDIALSRGWNLVASPTDMRQGIAQAFASIAGRTEMIMSYDVYASRWRRYAPQTLPAFLNDLKSSEPGQAYWIKANEDSSLTFVKASGEHIYYYHADHLGSNCVVTDESGTVVERSEFYPFGRTRYEDRAGSFNSAYKYTDQEFDVESGLYNYKARMYGSVFGRFISADSIVPDWYDPQSLNRYAYCRNNPLVYNDPSGHFFLLGAAIGAVVGGGMGAAAGAANALINDLDIGEAVLTGAIGGAAGGSITGSGAGLVVAIGAKLGITCAAVTGAIFGAAGGAVDNSTSQFSGNLLQGKSVDQSFKEINSEKVKNSAKWGAVFGSASGALSHVGKDV